MMLKNTVRILFSNFSAVWKIFLFRILFFALAVAIAFPFLSKINSFLVEQNVWAEVGSLFSFFNMTNNLPQVFDKLYLIVSAIYTALSGALAVYPTHTIFAIVSVIFVFPFFMGLCDYAVGEILFGSMGSGAKLGFTASFVGSLGKSVALQLLRTILLVPVALGVLWQSVQVYELFLQFTNLQFLMPAAIILLCWLEYSIVFTFFAGLLPASVVHNHSIIKSFAVGFIAICRKFWIVLSSALVLVFVAIVTTLMLGPWGVIALLSFFSFLLLSFEMVAFFEATGMRYYTDDKNIITPKKPHEIATISKLKRVI